MMAGGLGARMRNDSQKIRTFLTTAARDPQRSAEYANDLQRSAAMQQNVYRPQGELQAIEVTPQVPNANGSDRWPHWLEINLAKLIKAFRSITTLVGFDICYS